MRRYFFPLVALALLGLLAGGAWFFLSGSRVAKDARALTDAAKQLQGVAVQAGVDVDLSLKTITLSQGEAGRRSWRLTAQRARYLQEAGKVELEEPRVAYFFKDREGNMTVAAPQGLVEQAEKRARLWPRVRAEYLDNVIHADEMTYDGAGGVLTLTGDVVLTGDSLSCNASRMRLFLDSRDVVAENGVQAVLSMPPLTTPDQGAPSK